MTMCESPNIQADSIDPVEFKTTMRLVAASVHVITSSDGCESSGMTATAVCSVSTDPPSVLIVVNRKNNSHRVIARSGCFAVNLLSSDQRPLADFFAGKAADPFSEVPYSTGRSGAPLISGTQGYLDCVVRQSFESGTHTIFVGEVVGTGADDAEPLLYQNGRYCGLAQAPEIAGSAP